MARAVKGARRRYHSPLRADQAEQTRRRILDAAYGLFAENGYAGTTIAMVADTAGVAPETIYLSVGGKRGLLEGVIDSAIAGDESQVADDQRFWDDVALLPTARERLEKMVEYSCRILARTRPIHAVIRGRRTPRPSRRRWGDDGCRLGWGHRLSASSASSPTTCVPGCPSPRRGSATASWPVPISTTCSRWTWDGRQTGTGRG